MDDTALTEVSPASVPGRRGGTPIDVVVGRLADLLDPRLSLHGPAAEVHDVVIAEPGEPLVDGSGALVLAVGARGAGALALIAAAEKAGAAAVAVRTDPATAPVAADDVAANPVAADDVAVNPVVADGVPAATGDGLLAVAERAGLAVVGVPAGVRWDRVAAEAQAVLAQARGTAALGAEGGGDLFSLAGTVATLTQGVVSIEDAAHRVVAYAGSGDEADELRRLSVLGRSCPEPYLALLRRLGVYRRVREGDEVVTVAEHPELGARRRLVIGINSGRRPLGTIWVQEGSRPFAERAPEMLRGAARLAAAQLVDHYFQGDARARLASREELSHGLLTGRFDAGALAAHLGIDPAAGADVLAVDLREAADGSPAGRADARRAEAAGVMSVHAAAHRENALVVQACGQLYAILPAPAVSVTSAAAADRGRRAAPSTAEVPAPGGPGDDSDGPLVRWAGELVTALRRLTGTGVQAVVAGRARRLTDIPAVKLRGHRALQLLERSPEVSVTTHTRLTPALLVRDALELLDGAPHVRFPAVAALVVRDREHGTDLARSLLLYLDAFGDVAAVAQRLNVHPNTLRYRVRRAVALTGLDLDDPEHRLAATLQLRLDLRAPAHADTAFPAVPPPAVPGRLASGHDI
ncbi:helix-turn-helix domain-containing protein [Streptomyces sp. CRN 30]|uniref:PucR family transcriptional regulator n=1 Tax=Streptomyces sp. CRN 30 TaxID=3075613 RepID=UPI002A82FE6B|nr:helix-turn-helix domain-containing protein [Streptomyces sp. CRN 30]